jgi:7,8-dihydroneopterin aldolase/epimerase/oxygenase
MSLIALEGMQFYAYHGVYDEEQIIGNNFIVDIFISTDYSKAVEEDDIFKTINYETVYLVCEVEMRKKVKLLETLADNIILALKHQFNSIQDVSIKIAKKNPIPGARVANSSIETEESFVSKCPRCGKSFICYKDENCWCHDLRVHPKTRESIKQEFQGCLCKTCLSFYAG